uniref:26S proteasome regulatory subunit Rpn7 N-terminal domain-containing protein n=1 Tax=Aegilops tauschii subsp. strangulata TaxID=200361 RepID=A0A453KYB0_AEGTS
MDVESEVSADAAAAATNGLGGAGEAAAEDAEAVVVTNGLAGGGEASAEQRSLEAYAALYSGRTRLARLVFIAQRCGVEAIELAALRMAYDEAKAREDTAFYREAALRINGRLGPTHLLDQDWVDSVNHRAEQRKENLETELEVYKTCLHGESIRICYNDLGDFYYSHGRLTEAFKSYIKTEEYFSASEHVVQMCMKAILISVELGHNVRVLNFVSKAQGCQDPLSPIAIAKLQAVAGLARLGRKEYKLAAQEFLETGPELGSNYSEVIAAQDVATYGSLCALAFLNYSDIKMKVIENAKFGSFLSLFPEIRGLVNDFYYSRLHGIIIYCF